uniref:Uncharacterized LOC100178431 n=1 Tax=Ciona intestinalis TaxID=7719 RepID=F6XEP4_CIOIN|nr:uncharacterized protein LOC100178431 [Ciona intestinalis]|eukprot:XP_002122056.1 uncharacterized protein LOC100178431 [Ciona intestinalis]
MVSTPPPTVTRSISMRSKRKLNGLREKVLRELNECEGNASQPNAKDSANNLRASAILLSDYDESIIHEDSYPEILLSGRSTKIAAALLDSNPQITSTIFTTYNSPAKESRLTRNEASAFKRSRPASMCRRVPQVSNNRPCSNTKRNHFVPRNCHSGSTASLFTRSEETEYQTRPAEITRSNSKFAAFSKKLKQKLASSKFVKRNRRSLIDENEINDAKKRKGRSTEHLENKPSDQALKSLPKLSDVLREPELGMIFRSFLKSEFSEENYDFWVEVENYKRSLSAKVADNIYSSFIAPNSLREVNISAHARNETIRNLATPDGTIFNLAQDEIYRLMEKDSFSRFMATVV